MSTQKAESKKRSFSIGQYSYALIFIALFIVYYLVSSSLTWTGVTNILRHSAVIGVISFGMGLVIITGDIDLSVGSMLGCVASFGCLIFNLTNSILLTLLFCLAAGRARCSLRHKPTRFPAGDTGVSLHPWDGRRGACRWGACRVWKCSAREIGCAQKWKTVRNSVAFAADVCYNES